MTASATPFACEGRTAMVTGAGLGIGRASALRLAELGAKVIMLEVDQQRLSDTARSVVMAGGNAVPIVCDVSDEGSVIDAMAACSDAELSIDILVNNVGGGVSGRIWDLSVEDWDRTMALSLRSMFLCSRAVIPGMIERGWGRVICLSSGARKGTVWNAVHRGAAAYATAKAGVVGFVRDLALELGDSGVTINAVAPGPINTELAGPYLCDLEEQGLHYSPFRQVPMKRLGTPLEVADAIAFLASEEASYITGTVLDVAGGR